MDEIIMTDFSGGSLKTNYWQTTWAREGFAHCAIHDRTFHILLPQVALRGCQTVEKVISEMLTGSKVVVTILQQGVNFMFDDDTVTPYRLFLDRRQFSTLPAETDRGRKDVRVAVHTFEGTVLKWNAEISK